MDGQRSKRLITTTPATTVGSALASIKSSIDPRLLEGMKIQKISTKGTIDSRVVTISDDLFTIFVSHRKVSDESLSLKDRVTIKGYKAFTKVLNTMTKNDTKLHLKVVDVADILFVQKGFVGSRKILPSKLEIDPKKVVTLFYGNLKTLDFVVGDEEEGEVLVDAIQSIKSTYHSAKARVGRRELLLRYVWYDTDWNKSGLIDRSEFLQLLGRINIYLKPEKAIQWFDDYIAENSSSEERTQGLRQNKAINFAQCVDILRKITKDNQNDKEMHDIIFDELFGARAEVVTAQEFLTKFLHEKQHESNATLEDVREIFAQLNSMEISFVESTPYNGQGEEEKQDTIDRLRFEEYLANSMNDLHDPDKKKINEPALNEPLSRYWINTSHNTYLTGDQLKSNSSVEMYALAMHRGCKCLELDCWDDSKSEKPVIYHGYTITSKISFQDIISCVKSYIDANPDTLPIILSFENHCSHPYQRVMAEILRNTLEDTLFVPIDCEFLPSPLDLRGKVVIKGKRPTEADEEDSSTTVPPTIIDQDDEYDDEITHQASLKSEDSHSLTLPKIVPELAELTLLNGLKYKDFRISTELPHTDMHSLSETKICKILAKDQESVTLWKEYNWNHMTRTYPAGSRVDSSNFDPVVSWAMGCQLVALNFQTSDSPMTLNTGRFLENGGCGYVPKPLCTTPMGTHLSENNNEAIMLKIRVLSGSCLPKPSGDKEGEVIDPYVIVRIHDVDELKAGEIENTRQGSSSSEMLKIKATTTVPGYGICLERDEQKTDTIEDNGFSPQWNAGNFFFPVHCPDVAMVEFVVKDEDIGYFDDTMCKTAIPVSSLRRGYRSVHFYDDSSAQHGPYGFASILVEVDTQKLY